MNGKNKKQKVVIALLLSMLLAAGCGSSSAKQMMYDSTSMESITEEAPVAIAEEYEAAAEEAGDTGAGMGVDSNAAAPSGGAAADTEAVKRKLIREVNMSVETKDFDGLMADVTEQIGALGGYIESSDIYSDSIYTDTYAQPASSRRRSGSLKARIPADKLDGFLNKVAEVSNVTWKAENIKDVTLQYVDLESHKKALETEQARLLELLEMAESVEDVITIEGRLSEVRYQIESMESQLRTFDNQIDYSTVYMDITEVVRMTPVETDTSAWKRIKTGFSENIYRVTTGLQNFAIEFVIALPVIFVWMIGIAAVLMMVILVRKRCRRRKALKQLLKEQNITIQEKEENDGK